MQVSVGLGWVDLVSIVPLADGPLPLATYCPNRMREHAKSESTQPRSVTCLVTLYQLALRTHSTHTAMRYIQLAMCVVNHIIIQI